MKITKNKVIALVLILIVLAAAFWYGGNAPGLQGWNVSQTSGDSLSDTDKEVAPTGGQEAPVSDDKNGENKKNDNDKDKEKTEEPEKIENKENIENTNAAEDEKPAEKPERIEARPGGIEGGLSASEKVELAKELAGGGSSPGVEKGSKDYSESLGMVIDTVTGKDKYLTDPVPEGKPIPVEPQNATITDVERTCTLSVRCDTILNNIDWLDPEKVELVPEDGVIFATKTVTFYEGESVFNVLHREMKKAKIHMEFMNTPMYNSVYIEGINNLYEFDCGELSGWMYKVNGWFPNYGCSRYQLKEGDIIEWVYTCDLGVDVGGFYSVGD
ncbi:MAG TPA: hypothetical protein DC038_00255 [Clostridiales bacterium]|nr:hypothetical protein [Clostridiales bacterium]